MANKTNLPTVSSYASLDSVTANRGLNLQAFVDEMVSSGNRKEAYLVSGGDPDRTDATIRVTCHAVLALPEVRMAIAERAAQRFYELAPVANEVLEQILRMPAPDAKTLKIKADVALKVLERLQVDEHSLHNSMTRTKATEAVKDLTGVMGEIHEFIRKNPEWAGNAGRGAVLSGTAKVVRELEEDEPA